MIPGRSLAFVLAVVTLSAAGAGAVPLKVALRPEGKVADGARATVRFVPADKAAGKEQKVEALVPGEASLDVAAGSAWQVTVEAPGYWSRPALVVAGQPDQAAVGSIVTLVPAGTLSGAVQVPAGQAMPKEMALRFRPAPGAAKPQPEAAEVCPIEAGRFRCALPAGALDLRLKAKGFLTQYRWDARVLPGKTFDLGTLALKPGAAVVGWIEAPARDFRFSECSVRLEPQAAGGKPGAGEAGRQESLVDRATVNSRGFFAFDGVAPGSYRVVASHAAYAPSTLFPVQVMTGAETEVKRMAFEKPATFEVHLTPEKDPYGQRWTVDLLKDGPFPGRQDSVARGIASAAGVWKAERIAPGPYALAVSGSYTSRWTSQQVEVSPGMAPYEVALPFVRVEGVVSLGKTPIRALLWFGGRHGVLRIPAKSDEKGVFTVVLPQKPSFRVEIENAPEHIQGVLAEVTIPKAEGDAPVRIELTLPDTAVSGTVVDEAGKPVPEARVSVVGDQWLEDSTSRPEGRFTLRGLAPGDWNLDAESADRESVADLYPLHLAKEPVSDLRLVLRKRIHLKGLVVGPDGEGLPGVQVVGRIEQYGALFSDDAPQTFTDVDGQFSLRLPAAAQSVQLTVLPPGFAVRQLRVDAQSGAPLIIPVGQVGGTVVFVFSQPGDAALPPPAYRTYLFHDFQVAYPDTLVNWATLNGLGAGDPLRLAVPMLEPGSYTACFDVGGAVQGTGMLPSGGIEGRCASGELGPFGELALKVPLPKASTPALRGKAPQTGETP